jgi:hypothetical protein
MGLRGTGEWERSHFFKYICAFDANFLALEMARNIFVYNTIMMTSGSRKNAMKEKIK